MRIHVRAILGVLAALMAAGIADRGARADPSPAKRLKVRIESVRVTKSESYGIFGEPGASAEWRLKVTVNGESREYANDDVRDNTDHVIGYDFYANLVNTSTNLSVRTSGYEIDDTSANDKLPAAEATHGSADNWGVGMTRTLRAADADFDYTIYYTVTVLED